MGFSTIGAGLILFAGLLFATSTAANAIFEAQRDVRDAFDVERTRDDLVRESDIALVSAGHDGQNTFYLNITNSGSTVLDASHTVVLLDGAWSNGAITSRTIEGRVTDLWAPGETLRLEITSGASPDRARFVAETGHSITWTS